MDFFKEKSRILKGFELFSEIIAVFISEALTFIFLNTTKVYTSMISI